MKRAILIVDDEQAVLFAHARYFGKAGYDVAVAPSLAEARDAARKRRFDAVLLDLHLPDGNGIDWIHELREDHPGTAIVIITGASDIPTAVEAMRQGADQYLVKPVNMAELDVFLRKSLEVASLRRTNEALRRQPRPAEPWFGESDAMQRLREPLGIAAESNAPVLLQGETGAGKGVFARWIHDRSSRAATPMLEVNCSAIRGELLASELFGHARGAFTSAHQSRQGLLEVADGGTLFLDEIGDMDPEVQAQLLKVIEDKSFRRVGENHLRWSDFRLICATNRDLAKEVANGSFRGDLLFRINLFPLTIPPLRERREDIPGLVKHLLLLITGREPEVPAAVMAPLLAYAWPGNVRELRNVLERAVLLSRGGPLAPEHVAGLLTPVAAASRRNMDLKDVEREYLRALIAESRGDLKEVAATMKVSRATLYRKLKSLKIDF